MGSLTLEAAAPVPQTEGPPAALEATAAEAPANDTEAGERASGVDLTAIAKGRELQVQGAVLIERGRRLQGRGDALIDEALNPGHAKAKRLRVVAVDPNHKPTDADLEAARANLARRNFRL